jgi:frataxin-like iron-binding protein CyaY
MTDNKNEKYFVNKLSCSRKKNPNSDIHYCNNFSIVDITYNGEITVLIDERESYKQIVLKAINTGFRTFSPSARIICKRNIEKFLEFYIENYDNAFSRNLKSITNIEIVQSEEEF